MSKATKVFLILFVSVFTAGVAANIICEIFKTRLQKYYSVAKFPTIRVKAHRAKRKEEKPWEQN